MAPLTIPRAAEHSEKIFKKASYYMANSPIPRIFNHFQLSICQDTHLAVVCKRSLVGHHMPGHSIHGLEATSPRSFPNQYCHWVHRVTNSNRPLDYYQTSWILSQALGHSNLDNNQSLIVKTTHYSVLEFSKQKTPYINILLHLHMLILLILWANENHWACR